MISGGSLLGYGNAVCEEYKLRSFFDVISSLSKRFHFLTFQYFFPSWFLSFLILINLGHRTFLHY
jgi:hypothetical protein